MIFFLGTHRPEWLWQSDFGAPLFVSRRRLKKTKRWRPSFCEWALDSGGFTQISKFGEWDLTPREYAILIRRCMEEIGRLAWAAPMDWMCEPFVLKKTQKTVREHQRLTVENFVELKSIAPDLPIIPVLQGFSLVDYLECLDMYEALGIDLAKEPIVGVGSVCRRQAEDEAARIFAVLAGLGLLLHGFGVKTRGVEKYARTLASADSMAWSYAARRERVMLPGCAHAYGNCANCPLYARSWRDRVVEKITAAEAS